MLYKNKEEAVRSMVNEMFSAIPTRMIMRKNSPYRILSDGWSATARLDEEEQEEEYGYADVPMWGWVWLANDSYMERFIDGHRNEIMDLGFTILENYEEGWLCIGIDGAGFDFYEAYWVPLYDLIGFKWHERK